MRSVVLPACVILLALLAAFLLLRPPPPSRWVTLVAPDAATPGSPWTATVTGSCLPCCQMTRTAFVGPAIRSRVAEVGGTPSNGVSCPWLRGSTELPLDRLRGRGRSIALAACGVGVGEVREVAGDTLADGGIRGLAER